MDNTYTSHYSKQFKAPTLTACLTLAITLLVSIPIQAEPLQTVEDFEQLAATMQETSKPLVLTFDAEHCHYCKRLEADHLQPMLNNNDYKQRILIRSIEFDGGHEIKDFAGKPLTASDFSSKYKVRITPTILFLNAKGEEIVERMLGYNTPELYGAYLDRAIDKAVAGMAE